MKKLLSVLLTFILIFTISVSAAENKQAGEELTAESVEQTEGTEEADRSYVISQPVNPDRLFRRPTCSQEEKGL